MNKTINISLKMAIFTIAGVALFCTILSAGAVYATNYLFESKDVRYDNDPSKIKAGNVQDAIDELYAHSRDFNELREMIYPVGSIYISVTDSTVEQVEERFGGTWEAFGEGRTLVGVGTGIDSNSTSKTFTINTTGGEYNHTLTIDEMPSHTHRGNFYATSSHGAAGSSGWLLGASSNDVSWNIQTGSSGGSQSHNNIQPYITVYMWKRTS